MDTIKAVVNEYRKLASGQESIEEQHEIVVDGDMVRSKFPDDDDAA